MNCRYIYGIIILFINKRGEKIMFQKLDEVEKRYEDVTRKISDPEIIAQQSQWKELMK